ncbi:hypothetical protein [Sphingobacterium griseoflavum]|uniref:DUF4294 domain-containing protein n=1 Tax=Sphingobacterium griseoflavum TaxID=1474952 RepID=A0ABQ3HXB8_9SPHI|nr:hypothetical protein [Sphingobacterium griseoflavum]GHE32543.1 hypothetical protein GCM10017764_14350 [Sphingobacterium griseoflavum]
MKKVLALLTLFVTMHASAQQITFFIRDKYSSKPITGANVHLHDRQIQSNDEGRVVLDNMLAADSITIAATHYHQVVLTRSQLAFSSFVELEPLPQLLDEVVIDRMRSASRDTSSWRRVLARRIERENRNKRRMGIFIPRGSTDPYWPRHMASGSTAALVTLNLRSLFSLLQKKQIDVLEPDQWSDLEEKMLAQWFRAEIVTRVTGLNEDALSHFMVRYKPQRADLPELTEYDVLLHIKRSYKIFTADTAK